VNRLPVPRKALFQGNDDRLPSPSSEPNTALSGGPAPATADATPAASCTAWLFDGCCTTSEERQKRTCTDGTVSFTETRCVVVGECI